MATNLLGLVWHYVRSNGMGLVLQAGCGYQLFADAPNRVRFADASCIRRGKLPEDRPPEEHGRVAPDLVIAVVSPHGTAYANRRQKRAVARRWRTARLGALP